MQTHSLAIACRRPLEAYDDTLAAAPGPGNLRILIVNEDMRSADSLKCTLQELGYSTTFTAYSARRALTAAVDYSPAVVILDLELPDMTGYQLAHKLRSHLSSTVRCMPLLAVAERHVSGTLELTRAAGFIGYVTKPVLSTELHSTLRQLP